VKDRAVFGHVDVFAREHRVTAFGHAGLLGEFDEESQSLVGDELLGVIKVEVLDFEMKPLSASGILVEKFPQMKRRYVGAV
jgi:hypothetical protein